jgi:hypothetical protein
MPAAILGSTPIKAPERMLDKPVMACYRQLVQRVARAESVPILIRLATPLLD